MEKFNEIINWFAANNMPLDFFPAEGRALWQFDGGPEGTVVQLYRGINRLGKKGIFGQITMVDDSSIDISCCEDSWLEDMVPWIKENMK